MPHKLPKACSLVDRIYLSSVGHIFILFMLLKVKKVFMIHGFEFRYILLYDKLPSCIKDPHHEENDIVTVGSRVSQREKSFVLPGSSP